jgi:hypothetical protein
VKELIVMPNGKPGEQISDAECQEMCADMEVALHEPKMAGLVRRPPQPVGVDGR